MFIIEAGHRTGDRSSRETVGFYARRARVFDSAFVDVISILGDILVQKTALTDRYR